MFTKFECYVHALNITCSKLLVNLCSLVLCILVNGYQNLNYHVVKKKSTKPPLKELDLKDWEPTLKSLLNAEIW